jgi:hypothetical protein
MSLFTSDLIPAAQITRPGQTNQAGDINAQAITEYGGHVEHTIERRSALAGWVPMRSVVGTNSVTNFAVGSTTVGKVVPGTAPPAGNADFSKAMLTIDTLIYARNTFPLLEIFQTSYDARKEVGVEHGISLAKQFDSTLFIQAAKAASLTESRFAAGTGGKPAGHSGGSTVTMAASGDALDPAKLYKAIRDLVVKFEEKDVSPQNDDLMLAVKPAQFYALADAEQIINGDYKTSDGNVMTGVPLYKALGVPVISSNNIPSTNITGHLLSNATNGNAYDGNFTKLVGLMFSTRALLGGTTIPLTSDVFYSKEYKMWFVDSHMSYGVTPNRAEFAGAIWLP